MHAEPHREIDHSRDKEFPLLPKLICTSLGAGYLPKASGTWGACLGIILWLPLFIWGDPAICAMTTAAATVLLAIVGSWASTVAERYWGPDPVIACVDETVGQWFSLIPVVMCPWWEIILALALFRFFDIFKPLGIRSLERLPGGIGMMADDLLAGFYSAAILLLLNYLCIWI